MSFSSSPKLRDQDISLSAKVKDIFILMLLAIIISIIVYNCSPQSFGFRYDAADYASIARNLVRGQGLHSDVIYPISLTFPFLRKVPQPLVYRCPLYPLVLAGFFYLTSISDQSIKLLGILFFVMTIPVVYILVLAYYNRLVAVLTSLFTLLNPCLFIAALRGMTGPMTVFLFAVFLFFMFAKSKNKTLNSFICGVVFGLLFLTRNYFLLILPAATYYLFSKYQKHSIIFLISFFLVSAPWLIRNYQITGNPLFTLHSYSDIAIATLNLKGVHTNIKQMPLTYILKNHPYELLKGFGRYALTLVSIPESLHPTKFLNIFMMINPLLFIFLFFPTPGVVKKQVKYFLIILVAGIIVPFSLFSVALRLYFFLIPLLTMLAIAKFTTTFPWEKGGFRIYFSWGLLVLITLLLAGFSLKDYYVFNSAWDSYEDKRPKAYAMIDKAVKNEKVVVSDSVTSYAWYADQTALYLPSDVEALIYCHQYIDFNSLVLFNRRSISMSSLRFFQNLAKEQSSNITISVPSKGRYVVRWKTFPLDFLNNKADFN